MSDDGLDELANRMPTWMVVILGIGLGTLFLWIFVGGYLHSHARNKNPRYTIGYVTGTDYVVGPNSHSVAYFTYTAGDSTYRESSSGDVAEGCTRCLVKFAADDPANHEFFNRVCVPEEAGTPPAAGWPAPPRDVVDPER